MICDEVTQIVDEAVGEHINKVRERMQEGDEPEKKEGEPEAAED